MTKYFTIATSGFTIEEERAVADTWRQYGWWHWISNFWLLRDHTEQLTVMSVRDTLAQLAPGKRTIVLEVEPKTWAGFDFDEANRTWLRNYWPPEGS